MPRIRWAVRCHARSRRAGGGQCGAWAVRGAKVCAAHGGRAPRARREAAVRLFEVAARREFDAVYARWEEAVRRFHVDRVLTAARVLGKPVGEIDRWDIILCHAEHGVPPLEDEAPKITDIPRDQRYARFQGR